MTQVEVPDVEPLNKKHLLATVVVWIGIAILAWMLFAPRQLELKALSLLPEPKTVEIDIETWEITRGLEPGRRYALLFAGFTHCPDVCPLELQKLAQVIALLKQRTQQAPPDVYFVTVDPERDDLATLKQYVEHFNPQFIGLRGTNQQVAEGMAFFAAPYSRSVVIDGKTYLVEAGADMPEKSGDNYEVSHSSRIFVVDPMGRYIGSFAPPHDVETITTDLLALMQQ